MFDFSEIRRFEVTDLELCLFFLSGDEKPKLRLCKTPGHKSAEFRVFDRAEKNQTQLEICNFKTADFQKIKHFSKFITSQRAFATRRR